MLIWKLLTPGFDQFTVSTRRTFDGKHFFGPKAYDEYKGDKVIMDYLLRLTKAEDFQTTQTGDPNLLTRQEASEWLKEIVHRQHLTYIGLTNPELNVMLDPSPSGNNFFRQKMSSKGFIDKGVYESGKIPADPTSSDFALNTLNQFLSGGRLITPMDIRRLKKLVDRGIPLEDIIEWGDGMDRTRNFGVWGKNENLKTEAPSSFVERKFKEAMKACGGGK